MKKITITLNDKKIFCEDGKNIWKVAMENGVRVPSLCHHPDFKIKANCRICVVEVKKNPADKGRLITACSNKVESGLIINTDSPAVKKARNLNIELIFAEHIEKCPTCIWRVNCALLNLAVKYGLNIKRFKDRKGNRKTYKFANAVEIDGTQCIDCRNCVDACSVLQNINYLKLKGKGANQEVVPVDDKNIDCIYCGQCAVHCPVGAAQEQADWDKAEKILQDKKIITVAQFAPSIRVSIGEEFGLPYGQTVTGQLVTALRKLGFDYVFDVNFGADVTTMVEAEELLARLNSGGCLPMMTSCCPGWVKYLEFYHPELIPNLTTARSPHIHLGGLVKTYWSKIMNIPAEKIKVVSVMPCTAKKFEVSRTEMKIGQHFPVDYVITTREFAWLMKKNNINFPKLASSKADNPMGEASGAGAIYGASGGVMESALRTAQFMACREGKKNNLCDRKIDFKDVRGLGGIKEATVNIAGKNLRVAVVNGIGHVEPVLENLKDYDYIEVMACPGGCIGGGGQPIPTTDEIRKKRMEALYALDKSGKIRKAHENKGVLKALAWLEKKGLGHKVLHTRYVNRRGLNKK